VKNGSKVLSERGVSWKYDLPRVDEVVTQDLCLGSVHPSPNAFDDVYLELPRCTISLRGLTALVGSVTLAVGGVMGVDIYWGLLADGLPGGWVMNVIMFLIPPVSVWALFPYVKLDFVLPRDEPIRFNRLRRKIYLYEYRFDRFYIFSRKRWGVQPVAYNWDDVTAEVYRINAPGHGGRMENVMLSVRNPETNEVIDRVFFTHDLQQGEAYWAIARLFMQQGPEALPAFVDPPRNWNDDDDGLSIMHCLAPKVEWPAEIDRESRTAPTKGETL
jgi:hypothetical protein